MNIWPITEVPSEIFSLANSESFKIIVQLKVVNVCDKQRQTAQQMCWCSETFWNKELLFDNFFSLDWFLNDRNNPTFDKLYQYPQSACGTSLIFPKKQENALHPQKQLTLKTFQLHFTNLQYFLAIVALQYSLTIVALQYNRCFNILIYDIAWQ